MPLSAVVVTPGFFGVMGETLAARQLLTRDQVESAPQIGADVFRAVTRLPGVASTDLSAAFGVRGSRPDQVLVTLDGLDLYEPFHLKDFDNALSIVDLAAIGGVELSTGGFGAQYGDRIGGVFDMRSAAVPPGPPRTEMGLSITAIRAASRGSFAGERARWLASARRGYLDLALRLVDAYKNASPTYHDILGKVELQAGRSLISAHVLHAGDALRYEGLPNHPRLRTGYTSTYAWMGWRGPVASTLSQHTTLGTGRLTWRRGSEPGTGPGTLPLEVDDARSFHFVGVRQEWTGEWSERTLTRAGVHLRRLRAEYDYQAWRQQPFPRDGVLGHRTDTTRVRLSPSGTALDAWLLQRVRLLPSLVAEFGVHRSSREHTGGVDWAPRLNVALSPDPVTTFRASWGLYAQSHGIHELATVDGQRDFDPSERSEQRGVGVERMLPHGISVRFEAYDRRLTRVRSRWVNLDMPDDLFPELARARLKLEPAGGRAMGVELSARAQVARGWSGSASYALARAYERIGERDVPVPRDQRHALGLDLLWTPNARWRLAATWQRRSGWPRTPVDFRVERLRDGTPWAHYLYEPYNSGRLPAYHRLDLRATRHFSTRLGKGSVFLDVFNAYGRKNYRAIIPYHATDAEGRVHRHESLEPLLPRFPSAGVSWTF